MRRINVAIAGLGRVGSQFLDALLSVNTDAVKVIAVAEPREDLESVKKAKERGIAYYKDARDMLRSLEDAIDVRVRPGPLCKLKHKFLLYAQRKEHLLLLKGLFKGKVWQKGSEDHCSFTLHLS